MTSLDSDEEASTPNPALLALYLSCWNSLHPDLCLAPSFRYRGLNSMLPPVPAIYLFALRSNYLSQINISRGPGLGERGKAFFRWACPLAPGYVQPLGGAGRRSKGERKGEARMFPVPLRPLTPLLQGPVSSSFSASLWSRAHWTAPPSAVPPPVLRHGLPPFVSATAGSSCLSLPISGESHLRSASRSSQPLWN